MYYLIPFPPNFSDYDVILQNAAAYPHLILYSYLYLTHCLPIYSIYYRILYCYTDDAILIISSHHKNAFFFVFKLSTSHNFSLEFYNIYLIFYNPYKKKTSWHLNCFFFLNNCWTYTIYLLILSNITRVLYVIYYVIYEYVINATLFCLRRIFSRCSNQGIKYL